MHKLIWLFKSSNQAVKSLVGLLTGERVMSHLLINSS